MVTAERTRRRTRLRARTLITIDWMAGATAGLLMLALHPWLVVWYGLPRRLVLGVAAANLGYALVSFTLARRSVGEQVRGLRGIAIANMAWGVWCVVLATRWWHDARALGLAQLLGEGVLVGALGVAEWIAADRSP